MCTPLQRGFEAFTGSGSQVLLSGRHTGRRNRPLGNRSFLYPKEGIPRSPNGTECVYKLRKASARNLPLTAEQGAGISNRGIYAATVRVPIQYNDDGNGVSGTKYVLLLFSSFKQPHPEQHCHERKTGRTQSVGQGCNPLSGFGPRPGFQSCRRLSFGLDIHWDGHDRIRELASRIPCNNPHWPDLFYRWFLNMVAHWRQIDRKYANCTVPLLVGPQAYRKSTFCRSLIPPELQAYYTDRIDFSNKRDAELSLNRFLLINMDEFDQNKAKSTGISETYSPKPIVNIRRPRGTATQEMRRYASFIGTSNHKDLLTDTSGNRRYIVINVTGPIDCSPIDYEQLYTQSHT